MPMVISLAFKLRILIDDIFQSRKHKTLMRSLRVQRSKLVYSDISTKKFPPRSGCRVLFLRETSFISWLLCLFFHAGQRNNIWYLTSASFKNFIRCDSCSYVPFRSPFQVSYFTGTNTVSSLVPCYDSNLIKRLLVFFETFFFFFFFFFFFL